MFGSVMITVFSAYTSTIRFLVIAYQEYINVQTYSPSYVVVYVLISRLIIPYKKYQYSECAMSWSGSYQRQMRQFRHFKTCLWSLDLQYGVNNQVYKVVILIRRLLMEIPENKNLC